MKAIFIMADTFRRDHIGAYGNRWIHTPHLDRLAAQSFVFDHAYIGSFPTLPNRRDIHLGRVPSTEGVFNRWAPIADDEETLADRLTAKGVPTMMVNDVANSVCQSKNVAGRNERMNFQKGFMSYAANRGQEADNMWLDDAVPLAFPVDPHLIRYPADTWHRVLMNRAHRRVEDDWFAPGTYKIACEWLERNWKRDEFFLWVETFDPHEPWDPPPWYIDRYDPGYKGRVFEAPTYGFYRKMGLTPRECRHIAARYAAECDMVDKCVGRLTATLDRLGILDEVAIVFTSDHGAYFGLEGDNGLICKPHAVGADGMCMAGGGPMKQPMQHLPQTTGVSRVPLMVHMPGLTKPKRIRPIVQPWDLHPTLLKLFGQTAPPETQGQSLFPLMDGKGKWNLTRAAVHAGSLDYIQATTPDWIYVASRQSHPNPILIDLEHDPKQSRNVAKQHPGVCKEIQAHIVRFCRQQPGVTQEYLDGFVSVKHRD